MTRRPATAAGRSAFDKSLPQPSDATQPKEKIMKKRLLPITGPTRAMIGALALAVLFAFGAPQAALANTAANSIITNQVTVNYQNTSGVAQPAETASATITVNLVVTTPNLSAPIDQTVAFGVGAIYSYTLTATANGPATYDLTDSITAETNISLSSTALSVASLDLGATTLAATTDGSATITVPYDGTNDSVVNGIAVGDTIDIGGVVYTVDAGGISENAGTNLATITLTAAVPAGTSAGTVVGEQKPFTLTVTPGNDPAAQNNATIDVTVSAQDNGALAAAATDDTITTVTVTDATLTVSKEVSTDGATFGAANAAPGATLYYRITVTNGSTTTNANSVVISDPQPQFTTYDAGSAKVDSTIGVDYATAATTLTDADAGDDGYDFNVTTGDTATYSISTLAPGASVVLFFTVTIN
jgi:uncharacterized repeat protein (TIGR01451 family)